MYKENKNISLSSLELYKSYLDVLDRTLNKLFKEAKEEDILSFLRNYKTAKSKNGKISLLKQFYRYIYGLDKYDKLPECIRRIERAIERFDEMKYRERVITEEEYNSMLLCCNNPQQKTIIETLYNFGVRRSEMLSIRLKDVKYDGENTKIKVRESKTETREAIYKGRSKHLLEWTETLFPYKDEPDKYVFFSSKSPDKHYTPENINHMVRKLGKDAGIKRRIKPHDFRHMSITNLRKEGVPDTHIKTNTGLTKDSKQIGTYDHNKLRDYEEWLRKRKKESKPTYDLLEGEKRKLEEDFKIQLEEQRKKSSFLEKRLRNLEEFINIKSKSEEFQNNQMDKLEEEKKNLELENDKLKDELFLNKLSKKESDYLKKLRKA